MRISSGLFRLGVGVGISLLFAGAASAACGPGKLGTSRVIKVDTSNFRHIRGTERSFGLRHKEVVITFDDGPIAGKTPRILKALRRECVKATFFYVGKMARAYPRLVRRVVAEGHTLGHHTHAHNNLPKYSTRRAAALIDKGIVNLERVAYGKSRSRPRVPFFRYPYLARTKRTDNILRRKGLIAIGTNIDANDWKRVSPNTVHNRIMRRLRRQGKGIILMHDIQARTAKMLPRLLRSLKREGYKVVHMVPAGGGQRVDPTIVTASLDTGNEGKGKPKRRNGYVKLASLNAIRPTLRPVRSPAQYAIPVLREDSSIQLVAAVKSRSDTITTLKLPTTAKPAKPVTVPSVRSAFISLPVDPARKDEAHKSIVSVGEADAAEEARDKKVTKVVDRAKTPVVKSRPFGWPSVVAAAVKLPKTDKPVRKSVRLQIAEPAVEIVVQSASKEGYQSTNRAVVSFPRKGIAAADKTVKSKNPVDLKKEVVSLAPVSPGVSSAGTDVVATPRKNRRKAKPANGSPYAVSPNKVVGPKPDLVSTLITTVPILPSSATEEVKNAPFKTAFTPRQDAITGKWKLRRSQWILR